MNNDYWPLALAAGFGMVFGAYFHIIWKETSTHLKKITDAYKGKNKKAEQYVRWEAPPQGFNCRCLPLPVLPGDDSLVSALRKQLDVSNELRVQLEEKTSIEGALRNVIKKLETEKADSRATQGYQVLESPTYHDVVVHAQGRDWRLFDHAYSLQLICTRAAGWELWNMAGDPGPTHKRDELMGGEYAGLGPFSISVQGMVICQAGE